MLATAEAAAEAAISRVYNGIYFPFGNQNGQGRCIGQVVLDRVRCMREST